MKMKKNEEKCYVITKGIEMLAVGLFRLQIEGQISSNIIKR